MEKINVALGLKPDASIDEALDAIETLKASAEKKAEKSDREKAIQTKMQAGLSREVAIEAIENQEKEDAAKKKK